MAEKKKFGPKDFWYYYKIPVILGVVCALILAVLISQCAAQPDYDYEITLYMATPVPEPAAEWLGAYLSQYGEDLNGDGEVLAQVINCSFSGQSAATAQLGQIGKFQARLATKTSALFLVDEDCFSELEETGLFAQVEGFDAHDGQALSLESRPVGEAARALAGGQLPAQYYLCLRQTENTGFQGDPEAEEACRSGQALIRRMLAAEAEGETPPLSSEP